MTTPRMIWRCPGCERTSRVDEDAFPPHEEGDTAQCNVCGCDMIAEVVRRYGDGDEENR